MPSFEVDQRSIRLTVRNFRGTRQRFRRAATLATNLAGVRLLEAIRANVSVPPIGGTAESHRRALAELDHPYATRHGRIQVRVQGAQRGVSAVHTVTGRLLSAIGSKFDRQRLEFSVTTDTQAAPHLVWVVQGTRVMIARDVLWATAQSRQVRREMLRAIVFVFGRVFRSRASLRLV